MLTSILKRIVVDGAELFLVSWVTMLLFGWIHTWVNNFPALGFWQTMITVAVVQFLCGFTEGIREGLSK